MPTFQLVPLSLGLNMLQIVDLCIIRHRIAGSWPLIWM
jgi:hypothetical protein